MFTIWWEKLSWIGWFWFFRSELSEHHMLVKDIWKVSSIFSDTKFWTKETDIFLCVCTIKSRENLENFESVDFNKFHANVKVKKLEPNGWF